MTKLIQIDFDGVIHDTPKGYLNGELYGTLVKDAYFSIKNFLKEGYQVEILTSRSPEEWPKVKEWLGKHGLDNLEVTNIKKSARFYIDDRAIRFTTWRDVSKYVI